MSKLNIDQKTIVDLFSDKKTDFLIPDYQRPYAWENKECQQLWEDIFSFAFPDDDYEKFNNDEEYFLGTIVTFKNEDNKKLEVIDGQQRLTTLMLLLRAFYSKFGNMQDKNSLSTKDTIGKCIWKGDEFGNLNMDILKIDSEVATDNDKGQFLSILRTGTTTKDMKSKYAENYRFFEEKIDEFLGKYPSYFPYLPNRILKNCILLPIEAESQDTALRIFSTLNNRGLPLSDADIFKSEFYKAFTKLNRKDEFIKRWKELEEKCNKYFKPQTGTPLDELFTRYMYYERAKMGITKSTTEALRTFYSKDKYKLLNTDTLCNLEKLIDFWMDVLDQSEDRFSADVIRQLFILEYAPNGMWTYFLSVYFLRNRDSNDMLNNDKLHAFLKKITAFIWAYAVTNPGVNALRTPVYKEMSNIINGKDVEFGDSKFDEEKTKNALMSFNYLNGRPITKSMLVWWAMNIPGQIVPDLPTGFEIEHIYARNRNDKENSLSKASVVELIGNKAILEKRINIRASDYRFEDKKKYYLGYTNKRNEQKEGTVIKELENYAKDSSRTDFGETDINKRTSNILSKFIDYLREENLFE
jgi:uncharacterized protein with ParB-like and HNH nuclease domain